MDGVTTHYKNLLCGPPEFRLQSTAEVKESERMLTSKKTDTREDPDSPASSSLARREKNNKL